MIVSCRTLESRDSSVTILLLPNRLPPALLFEKVSNTPFKVNARKAPGLDIISTRYLQAASVVLILNLFTIFNSALRFCHFPAFWKTTSCFLKTTDLYPYCTQFPIVCETIPFETKATSCRVHKG